MVSRKTQTHRQTSGRTPQGTVALGVVAALAVVLWSGTAAAWKFDSSCGAESQTRNFELMQAQAYIMLDESGSMGSYNKWDDATDAIKSAVYAKTDFFGQDVVQFGLGWFSNGASNRVSPKEDAYWDIRSELNSNYPIGGTNIQPAIETSANTLQSEPDSEERPQASILITDGMPGDSYQGIVDEACQHRENVGRLHTVGFGSGTDEELNDLIAAAGGTGTCTNAAGNEVDPCDDDTNPIEENRYCYSYWYGTYCYTNEDINSSWNCDGSSQVSGGTGLKSVISGISNKLACEIEVANNDLWERQWGDDPYECSTDDYSCLKLSWGPTMTFDYNPDDPSGTGWQWRDENRQETIILNEQTCNEIEKSYTSNQVTVDRACMCDQRSPGGSCTNDQAETCECTTGTITCNQSDAECTPNTNCPVDQRKGYESSCSVGTGACLNEGVQYCSSSGTQQCGTPEGGSTTTVGEAGVQGGLDGATWRSVGLDSGNFDATPVVLSTTQTTAGGQDPSEAHITNVGTGGFSTQHCELDLYGSGYCDGHNTEKNGWAALDPSELDGLNGVEAGTVGLSGGVEIHQSFSFGTTFSSRPYVFANVQTNRGADVPRHTQIVDVDRSSATVELCEQATDDGCGYHNAEDVGWFAIDPSAASLEGVEMGDFTTSDSEWKRISFSSAFPSKPAVIAEVQSENGGQEALYAEVQNVTNTGADIRFCEYEGGDDCDTHTTERVAWVAFDAGEVTTQRSSDFEIITPHEPQTEVCNGVDDDCDGRVDEGASETCDTGEPGRCSEGVRTCENGSLGECVAVRDPVPEVCNGLDDDCSGQADDIDASWSNNDWDADASELAEADRERLCGKRSACVCPSDDAPDSEYRAPASSADLQTTFEHVVENTDTSCYCAE